MQLLRKITPSTVFGGREVALETVMKDKEKSHLLYRVVGICNGTKVGVDKRTDPANPKEWKALIGAFEATDHLTGEVFRSGVCFLPSFAVEQVAGQLTDEVQNVRFAFDVGAHYDSDSITAYVYDVTPLMEADPETDPLTQLAASLDKPKQIAAPKG